MTHDERCAKCKDIVYKMLERIYGRVIRNFRIEISTKPDDYLNQPIHSPLAGIYTSLLNHRNYTDFVKAGYVDVDFFIPDPGFIVEFDESQHFTVPRKISLEHYPETMKTGYSKERWIILCHELDKHDKDPPYRDEQRAWYDTLRDFLPEIKDFQPTVRLYSQEMEWCSLNPEKKEDVEKFRRMLQSPPADPKSWLATVTLKSDSYKYPDNDAGKNARKNADRMSELSRITTSLTHKHSGTGIVLFPGGYFHSGTGDVAPFIATIVDQIKAVLQDISKTTLSTIVVCLGVDGRVLLEDGPKNRYDTQQVAIAISNDGRCSYAKKFHPTDAIEAEVVDLAGGYLSEETLGTTRYSRVFSLAGRSFYLAVCNDIKGLRSYPKPESVDVILNCVHGCYNREDHRKDKAPLCNYFVRLNFAGASQRWKCPVFGAVVFFKREIMEKWRTGMLYRTWDRKPIRCETDENALAPILTDSSYVLAEGRAQVDVYDLDAAFSGSPVYREQPQQNLLPDQRSRTITKHRQEKTQDPATAFNLYERLRKKFDARFGDSVIDQKTKFTFRGKNMIGYPNKTELDMISLFNPTKRNASGVRFRIYPHVLAGHLHLKDVNAIHESLPAGSVIKQERDNPHPAEMFYEGVFTNEADVERFINWIGMRRD